jgi:hypothetical protein
MVVDRDRQCTIVGFRQGCKRLYHVAKVAGCCSREPTANGKPGISYSPANRSLISSLKNSPSLLLSCNTSSAGMLPQRFPSVVICWTLFALGPYPGRYPS